MRLAGAGPALWRRTDDGSACQRGNFPRKDGRVNYSAILLQAERAVRHPARPGAAGKYRHPRLTLVQRPTPALMAGQVLLEVCNVSVCGTDVHVLQTDGEGFCHSSVPASQWESGIQF